MSFTCFSPSWFFGYDIFFELLFFIVSIVIALFSLKIYRQTSQGHVRNLGIGFLFIAISYLVQSLFNFLILTEKYQDLCFSLRFRLLTAYKATLYQLLGIYAHVIFMTIGFTILLYMTLKNENVKFLLLFIFVSLLSLFGSKNILLMFYILSSTYLLFIAWHFMSNFLRRKQLNTLLIFLAFTMLFIGSVHFLFAMNHESMYVIGHVLELIAYGLILGNLALVLRK